MNSDRKFMESIVSKAEEEPVASSYYGELYGERHELRINKIGFVCPWNREAKILDPDKDKRTV